MSRPIILVHGAWHGGWCFDEVSGPLREQGFDVIAPDLPFTGEADDIAFAREIIAAHPGAVVLGHSYGGQVITHAAAGLDVAHLVYLCAFVGQQAGSRKVEAAITDTLRDALEVVDGKMMVNAARGEAAFLHDCPPAAIARAKASLRPMVMGRSMLDMTETPPWQTVPSTYVVCTDDQAIAVADQRRLAALCRHVVEWDVSHSPFYARPELLIELLAGLARG